MSEFGGQFPRVQPGDLPSAEQENAIRAWIERGFSCDNGVVDFTGMHVESPTTAEASQFAKLSDDLGPNSSVDAVVVRWNDTTGQWEDTTETITVYAPPLLTSGYTLSNGTYVEIEYFSRPGWVVVNAACG